MAEILLKVSAFVFIIILGAVLRRIGFFKESDYRLIAQIVFKVMLPCGFTQSFLARRKTFDAAVQHRSRERSAGR